MHGCVYVHIYIFMKFIFIGNVDLVVFGVYPSTFKYHTLVDIY